MKSPHFLRENVPLAPLTTLGLGGSARFYADLASAAELPEALAYAQAQGLPIFVLGGGSNVVAADAGFAGLVIRIALRGLCAVIEGETARVSVAAGEPWDEFVAHCIAQNWAGLETLSGIPGLAGGAPIQNVGAYGQEVSETIQRVRAYDRASQQIVTLNQAACEFAYRQSIFNTTARNRFIVLTVDFALRIGGVPALRYAELQSRFARQTDAPTLAEVREAVLEIRRRKGMMIDATDVDTRSVGSFFKNPTLTPQDFLTLSELVEQRLPSATIPRFVAADSYKIPAAWLIEQAGFAKGCGRGRVGLSSKHSLALINRGGATAAELVAFMQEIQKRVHEHFGLTLEPEPTFIGFSP